MIVPRLWLPATSAIWQTFGGRGLARRLAHEARVRADRFREKPFHVPTTSLPVSVPSFQIDPAALREATTADEGRDRAERVRRGEYQAFRWSWRPLPATAEEWLVQPDTGNVRSAAHPWWREPHRDPGVGDIKLVWEPARFAWVYDLVRGFVLTGDEAYVRTFVRHFQAWRAAAEPFRGAHWACGQEAAIRAVALLYGEAAFGRCEAYTSSVAGAVEQVLAATGERIDDALGYALSQRNNHGISESVGLIVLGDRFESSHPSARRWFETGRRVLFQLIEEQFAPDGWYIQHSFNYLRLALDQCVIANRVLSRRGGVPPRVRERILAAARLLTAVIDEKTGEVPNHGANDGSYVHPITLAPYRDFRPVLTAAAAAFGTSLPAWLDADREALGWLGLPAPGVERSRRPDLSVGSSGWISARKEGVSIFIRAGEYRSRPGHIDALHVDIRVDGREVVLDPGTYAYGAPAPWTNALASARVHNTPLVENAEAGVRGSPFFWYTWPQARLVHTHRDDEHVIVAAEIQSTVRRTVVVSSGGVTVHDELRTDGPARLSSCWLLHPDEKPDRVTVSVPARIVEAREGEPKGWFSPTYGVRLPSRCIDIDWPLMPHQRVTVEIPANRSA